MKSEHVILLIVQKVQRKLHVKGVGKKRKRMLNGKLDIKRMLYL